MRRGDCGLAVVAGLAFSVAAAAQEYSFRFYGPAEGLQNVVVYSLAQDHIGYIWAGTEGGLYRYDGTRFRLMGQAEGLPCATDAHGLFVASDGALWANTCAGIFRFDGQRFSVIPGVKRVLRGAQVMADAADGGVLIATPGGLYEAAGASDGSFSMHSYSLPAAVAGKPMHGILRQGPRLWFGCDEELCLEEAGQVSVFGKQQGLPEEAWEGIQVSADGSVWVRSARSLYRRAPGQARFSHEKPDLASSGFWGALAAGRDDSIMAPTDEGLAIHTRAGWEIVNRQRGLRNENTAAALQDREGSVWIGIAGGGLARWLGRGVWESWRMDHGLPSDIVWNIRRDRKGSLWVATSMGLTRMSGSGRSRTWTRRDGLGGDNVRWLAETSDGSIWAAMKPGGVARVDPASGKVHLMSGSDGLPCDPQDVFVDQHDRLWIPSACGLFINDQPSRSNRVTRVKTPDAFGSTAWKVVVDAQGTAWVTNRAGLWSMRDGQWRHHGREEGMATDNPYVMALAADGSIWLRHRYDGGIDRLEVSGDRIVRVTVIVPANPQKADGTAFHGFDAFGDFWRGTPDGVAVLRANTWTSFTTEDGLVSNDCNGEAFWADADGDVWLGTSGGLAHYQARGGPPPEPLTASPTITRLEINQQARVIQAEFSSLNYPAEQLVRFGYRLNNAPWTDSVARNVSITGVGAGWHRLDVRCRVRDGPFSPVIASTEFRLEPKWEETWWARLFALVCVLLAIMQFVRWRLSAAARKQTELEAIVAARTANLSKANELLDERAGQLRTSEGRLKNAERLAHVGHWDFDIKADQLSWSEEMFRIFDLPEDHVPGYEVFLQSVLPADRERVERWKTDCFSQKRGTSIEYQITRPGGGVRTVVSTSEVLLGDNGSPVRFFGSCQDVTDSRRAQQEDFARKKLESVGTLAGGIAHDFNNLLGGMLAHVELAMAEVASGSYPGQELTAIRNGAIRGAEIVRQLMMYAGKESETPELVEVSQIVTEMLELLRVLVSKRVKLVTSLGRNLPAVRASPAQIRQIVMNLVTNASDALGDRDGTIRVTTERLSARDAKMLVKGLAETDYLNLEVSDTGCGIPPEMQARVFDPFFTTKSAGHGLGLAVVHGIVRGLGGAINLESEPGQGTTFQVLLPCAESLVTASVDATDGSGDSERALPELTVLVVEDEHPLRQAVVTKLRRTGFTVLEAADGAVAIDLLRANGTDIDVVLLDMTMPGASSREVVAEASRARPNMRVILTSAYSQEMLTPWISASHRFIRKPYRLGDLVQAIRSSLS